MGVKTLTKLGWPKGGSSRELCSPRRGQQARLSLRPKGLVLKDEGAAGGPPTPSSVGAGVQSALFGVVQAEEQAGRGFGLVGSLQDRYAGTSPLGSPEGVVGESSWSRCSRPQGTGVATEMGKGTHLARLLMGGSGLSPERNRCFLRPGLAASSGAQSSGSFWEWAAASEVGLGMARASF